MYYEYEIVKHMKSLPVQAFFVSIGWRTHHWHEELELLLVQMCIRDSPEAVRETQAARSSPAEPSAGDEMDIGDTITTEHCRVTIEAIELAYDCLLYTSRCV